MAVGGAEEHFAKKLANNDRKIRDRALKRLQAWISSRPSTGAGFSEVELLKIWKGLFYCFWMSDKPLIQEELAENISKLQHCFKNNESGFVFIITFFKTMHKEWHGIDRLRLDKFYLLVRLFIKENFEFLKKNSWDPSICSKLCDIYKDGPLHPTKENVPDGIKLHFCGVFLSELCNVASEKVSSEMISLLLEPFFILAAESKSQVVSRAVKDGILDKLLEMKEQRRLENEVADDDDDDDDDDINHKEKQALQINIQAIADKLFTLGSDREILGRNRKVLYQYAKKFKKAVPDETEKQEKGRKRKLDKEKENDELDMPVKKKKKQRNLKSHRITLSEGEVENEQEEKKDEMRREKKRKKDPLDDTALDVNVNEIQTKPKKKKKKSKKKSKNLDINGNTKDMSTNSKESTEQTSNGFKEDQMNNFMELSFQGETKDSGKIVEKTIRELRSPVSSTQHVDKTPAKKKKNVEINEMPFATFTKTKTPPAFFKKALSQTEPRKAKQTKLACPKSDPQSSKKKVRIHLHKNEAQTPSDYAKSVSSSPSIPFDANRSPEFSLLKTKSLTNSHPSTTGKKNTPSKRSKAVDFF